MNVAVTSWGVDEGSLVETVEETVSTLSAGAAVGTEQRRRLGEAEARRGTSEVVVKELSSSSH